MPNMYEHPSWAAKSMIDCESVAISSTVLGKSTGMQSYHKAKASPNSLWLKSKWFQKTQGSDTIHHQSLDRLEMPGFEESSYF